jgi:AcrR family transcriptional regulator
MSFQTAEQRRHQQRADARRAILDAAESLLVSGGYEQLSIRRLAERCGYTAPTIYHYFGDKDGLLPALLEERFRDVLRLIRRVPLSRDPLDTIRGRARAFVRFGLRNPTHYRILTSGRHPALPPVAAAEEAQQLLEQPWRQLIAQERLRAAHLDLAQQSFFAMLHGLISLRTSRPDYAWSPGLVEESVDALLRGWVKPDSAAARAGEGAP